MIGNIQLFRIVVRECPYCGFRVYAYNYYSCRTADPSQVDARGEHVGVASNAINTVWKVSSINVNEIPPAPWLARFSTRVCTIS